MATATWPSTLPQNPLIGGWTWKPQSNRASFKPAVGPDIERRRGTAVVHKYDARFPPLTDAQVAIFETFFDATLVAGTLHYLWDDPVSGTSFKWKIESYQISTTKPDANPLSMKLNRLPGAAV